MSSHDLITVFCSSSFVPQDGGGIAYYGFEVRCNEREIAAKSGIYRSGSGVTSYVAEYGAVIEALHWLSEYGDYQGQQIELKSSSEVLIRQIEGKYKVRNERIRPLWAEVKELARPFSILFIQIPGTDNPAKSLSERARGSGPQYENEQVPDCDELRWRFALHKESSGYVCTISLQRRIDKQWVSDQSEPLYRREFERDIRGIHYNNFRARFVRDAGYRKRWRVGSENDAEG